MCHFKISALFVLCFVFATAGSKCAQTPVDGKPKQRKHGYSTHHYFGKLKDKTYWHQGSKSSSLNESSMACSINPCLNGGNCTVGANRDPVCSCAFGFKGKFCDEDACSINPCLNGGNCTVGAKKEAVCSCAFGFKGIFCDEDACSTNPCLNGGNCTVGANKEPKCSCAFGFKGTFCDEDACFINPCLNGGNCTVGANKEAVCNCSFGFKGTFCNEDACSVRPCLNGGNCTLGINRDPVCSCPVGFTGTFCADLLCPPRYNRQIGTGCYIFGSYTRVEFSAIVNGCKFLGGILFEPNDQAEFAAVLKYLEDIFVTGNARSSYWIGVTDQVSEGNVVYLSSGSPFTLFDLSGTNTEENDCVSLVKNETGTNFFPIMKTCQNTINKDGAICEYNFATGG